MSQKTAKPFRKRVRGDNEVRIKYAHKKTEAAAKNEYSNTYVPGMHYITVFSKIFPPNKYFDYSFLAEIFLADKLEFM